MTMAFKVLCALTLQLGLSVAGTPSLKLQELITNGLQFDAYINSNPSSAVQSNIFSNSKETDSVYTVGDAVAKLGTGTAYNSYNASNEPPIDRYIPNHDVPLSYPIFAIVTSNMTLSDGILIVTSGRTNQTDPALKTFARNDSIIPMICSNAASATAALEAARGPTDKTTFIVEKDWKLRNGAMGEMLMTFESLASPASGLLKDKCASWVGDMLALNTNRNDSSVVTGWRVYQKGSMILRLGLQINNHLSH